ncbi:hypothetical protein SLS53_006975 [Cytospora paraplurivora]|uniref:Uncharacterized protein n=1 Tax=Cytospora paraplurivora TaxID=2898453 RepID=A0AAN9YDH4_9PEZI
MNSSVIHPENMSLDTPPSTRLPHELLVEIAAIVADQSSTTVEPRPLTVTALQDLLNLCQTSRRLNGAATEVLYRAVYLPTGRSVGCFLFTLYQHPGLAQLVKGVFCPSLSGPSPKLSYAFWDFIDTTYNAVLSRNRFWEEPLPSQYFTPIPERIGGQLIMAIVQHLPHLKALTLSQSQLIGGPYTRDMRLQSLTKLTISVVDQPEVTFERCPAAYSRRLVAWLNPRCIGARFTSLEVLEIITPTGRWAAKLVPGPVVDEHPRRFVESLTTTRTDPYGPAEFDLVSLGQAIFHPDHFRTLIFASPGRKCENACWYASDRKWHLNRFLETTGRNLRALSLEWEWEHDGWYFNQEMHLTKLMKLRHLASLTISLQALFGMSHEFNAAVDAMIMHPVEELAGLLPESLMILRINEYTFGNEGVQEAKDHNRAVYYLVKFVRDYWLNVREGRELWFKRDAELDMHQLVTVDPMRIHLRIILGHLLRHADDIGGDFEQVPRSVLT